MKPIEITVPGLPQWSFDAITLWPFIFYRNSAREDIALRCHEYFHWRQAARWGVIPWYLAYVVLLPFYFRRAADQHPLEAPAYAEQREVLRLMAANQSIDDHLTALRVTTRVNGRA